jgi:aspartate beta-hydroxylase
VSGQEETRVRGLIQQAERAAAGGQRDEARRLLAQAEAAAPSHPMVLNAMALDLLQTGDPARARDLLQRALAAEPANPSLWMNLASAFHALGDLEQAEHAVQSVLKIEPRHLLALLKKAELLEQRGKPRAAASVYQNALQTLRSNPRLPAALREPITRAVDAVRRNDEALTAEIERAVVEVRNRHSHADLERADHGLAAFLGKRRIYHPQPTFLHVPKIPSYEFYRREDFAWLDEFEAATANIREECERVLREDSESLVPYIAHPDGVPLDQWAELNRSRKWSAFFLWRDGQRVDAHADRCPRTSALLARAPCADVPGYAPTAFFSILDKKSHIPPHSGVTNSRLIVHLPLIVPAGCRFRVGSETREWQVGKAWVFDDTIDHEAWNESEIPRAILIFDTWHPALTAGERDLIRAAVPAIKAYYRNELTISGSEQ